MQTHNIQITETRTTRTLERYNVVSSAQGHRSISPIPSSVQQAFQQFQTHAQAFLPLPHTPQHSKIGKSVSPSKYSTPTHTTPSSNFSNINNIYNKNTKIFTPSTPTITSKNIDVQFNKIYSTKDRYTPSTTPSAHYSGSPFNNTYVSPFHGSKTPEGSHGFLNDTPISGKYNTPKDISQGSTPYSHLKDTQLNFYSPYDPKISAGSTPGSDIPSSFTTATQYKPIVKTPAKDSFSTDGYQIPKRPISPINNYIPTQGKKIEETQGLFNRANFSTEAGYADPKKLQDLGVDAQDDTLMRFSVIKSDFKENPYYYNLDDIPESKQIQLKTLDSFNDYSRSSTSSLFQHSICLDHNINYKEQVKKLKTQGKKYQDDYFPANINSLVGENRSQRYTWQDFIWLRPEDFYGTNYDIFVDKIEPNDIKQGQLGDCYFLSVLSSLAEWPNRIRKIFVSKEKNLVGCYCVRMCVMGEWREIIVDDFFPCDPKTKKPVFTSGNENELWVLILEKAWAKLYGSYNAIEAGLARECLHDLTCAPTTFFLTDNPKEWDTIWKKILKCERKNYAMTCGAGDFFTSLTESRFKENIVNSQGIVSSHAYSLLAGYEVQSRRGKVKLVKLRNPWGKTEWNGSWSDDSSEWDDDLRKRLNVQKKDDGIFYMEYQDFLKYFSDIQFCFINDNFEYSHYKTQSDAKHAVYFKVTVPVQGKYYFTINQESKRKYSSNPMMKYSTVTIVLGKINKTTGTVDYEHIDGIQRADREVWVKGKLTPGEYLIYAKVAWNQTFENEFVLSSYGTSKLSFEKVSKTVYPGFLEKAFCSKARKSGKKMDYGREGEVNAYSVVELAKDGFIYSYYHNDSRRVLNVEVTYKEFSGLKLRKPYRGRKYEVSVNPGERKAVLVRLLPQQNVRQVFSERVKFTNYEPKDKSRISPPLENINTGINLKTTQYGEKKENTPTFVSNTDQIVREKGKKERLKHPNTNEFLDIFVYQYANESGVIFLYENQTRNWTLNEKVEFVGTGLILLQGTSTTQDQFELLPGRTHKLDFRKIDSQFVPKFKFHSKFKEN